MAKTKTAHAYELELRKMIESRRLDYEKIIHICQERIRQIDCEE